jgi:hypothetical protein
MCAWSWLREALFAALRRGGSRRRARHRGHPAARSLRVKRNSCPQNSRSAWSMPNANCHPGASTARRSRPGTFRPRAMMSRGAVANTPALGQARNASSRDWRGSGHPSWRGIPLTQHPLWAVPGRGPMLGSPVGRVRITWEVHRSPRAHGPLSAARPHGSPLRSAPSRRRCADSTPETPSARPCDWRRSP